MNSYTIHCGLKCVDIKIGLVDPYDAEICLVAQAGIKYTRQAPEENIEIEIKSLVTQQAGGQAIDFTVNGSALHNYKVTNTTKDNTTLQHKTNKIEFNFDGMGQKRSFNSDSNLDIRLLILLCLTDSNSTNCFSIDLIR